MVAYLLDHPLRKQIGRHPHIGVLPHSGDGIKASDLILAAGALLMRLHLIG